MQPIERLALFASVSAHLKSNAYDTDRCVGLLHRAGVNDGELAMCVRGFSPNDIAAKYLPSQPIWTQFQMDWGSVGGALRKRDLDLASIYQNNDVVHGSIDKIARTVATSGCQLMDPQPVKEAEKGFAFRPARKRLGKVRLRKLMKQWKIPQLARKQLDDDVELVEVTEHPMLDVLDDDTNDQDFQSLIYLIVISLCVWGRFYALKERTGGRVTSYRYLPAFNVSANRGGNGRIAGWYYTNTFGEPSPQKVPVDKDDMLVIRWPNLADPHAGGDSPLLSAIRKCELAGKLGDHENWVLDNRARPDQMFIPKMPDGGSLGKDEATRIEKKMRDKFSGPGNGRTFVAESAGTLVPMTYPPTELAGMKIQDQLETAIMFVLGVPEGFSNNEGNRANLEASLEQFARFAISPIVSLIEAALNKEKKKEFNDAGTLFVFENVVPEDEAFALEERKVDDAEWETGLTSKAATPDEYREKVLGLEPMTPQQKAELAPEPIDNTGGESGAKPAEVNNAGNQEVTSGQNEKSFDLMALNRAVVKGEVDRATAIKIAAFSLRIAESDAKSLVVKGKSSTKPKTLLGPALPDGVDLANAIIRQTAHQKQHYLNQCDELLATDAGKSLDDYLVTKDDRQARQPAPQFTREKEWDAHDQHDYKPYLQIEAERAANDHIRALVRVGAEHDAFSVVQPNLKSALDKSSLKFAQSTNETTESELNTALDQLRGKFVDGLVEGDPIPMLRKRVEDVFENISKDRATTIARTETSRAVHEAQRITAKASGIVSGFKFVVSPNACDQCVELDGKEVGLDEQFSPSDYDNSVLPVHPNCRCTMVDVLDLSDEPDREEGEE